MVSVFIPVLNEEAILEATVERVHQYLLARGVEHEILVVSNGSSDSTVQIGERLAATYQWFRFFHLEERGAGLAFRHGVRNARFEKFICLDADLSSEMAYLDYAYHLLDYSDMVLGSKTLGKQRRSLVRVLGSQLYILFAQRFFDLVMTDYSIGCKAFRRSSIIAVVDSVDPWTGYVFELVVYLRLHGRKIVQIGIDCDDRRASRFNLLHEGLFRYWHLVRVRRMLKAKDSWMHRAPGNG